LRNESQAFTLIELLIVVAIIAILAAIALPNFLEAQTRAKVSRAKADERSIATALVMYQIDYGTPPYYQNRDDGEQWMVDAVGEATYLPYGLTTPIAYMTSLLPTPFQTMRFEQAIDPNPSKTTYTYLYRRVFQNMPTQNLWKPWPGVGNRPANASYTWAFGARARWVPILYDCYNHVGWFIHDDGTAGVHQLGLSTRRATWVIGSPGPSRRFYSISRATVPQWRTLLHTKWPCPRYDPTNGTNSIGDILRFDAQ